MIAPPGGGARVCLRIVDGSVAMHLAAGGRDDVALVAQRVYGPLQAEPDARTAWADVREDGRFIAEGFERDLPHWQELATHIGALEALQALVAWGFSREHRVISTRGAAIARDGRCVVLTGTPFSGKTTLALRAVAAGWQILSEEYCVIDPATTQVHAFPKLALVRHTTLPYLPGIRRDALDGVLTVPWTHSDGVTYHGVDLDRLFGRSVWTRQAALAAFVHVVRHDDPPVPEDEGAHAARIAHFFLGGVSRADRILQGLALARRFPTHSLRRGDPARMLAQLEAIVGPRAIMAAG